MKTNTKGVIFKIKKPLRKRVFSAPKFFSKKSNVKKPKFNPNRSKVLKIFILILVVFLSVGSVAGIGALAYRYILNVRDTDIADQQETVFGFDIPSYPNSEYIFQNVTNNDQVENFISLGNSVYRLPKGKVIADVFGYYNQVLPNLGWTHVQSVPVDSESKLFGEYWTKEEKGIRIYSRLNDVWYQSVTVKQAQNGLDDVVKKDTARKLLLLTTEKTELLPDFPWRLTYPTEYATKYYSTNVASLQGVSFRKIGQENIVYIEPIGYQGANTLDGYIDKYIDQYNKKNKTKWVVLNSVEIQVNGNNAVKASITKGNKIGSIVALNNEANSAIYIIASYEENDPFQSYILEKIKPSLLNQ